MTDKLEVEVTRIDWETGEVTLKFENPEQAPVFEWLQVGWRYTLCPETHQDAPDSTNDDPVGVG
jgi:hypothetical protein